MSTFLAHSERVTALFPLSPFNQFDEGGPPLSPINSGMEFVLRMMKCRHCIVSVGLDRTVAVIDVEELFW